MSGITGVYSTDRKFAGSDLIDYLYSAQVFSQPRGEAGAGISLADQWGEIKLLRNLGPVRLAIPYDTLKRISNPSVYTGIGHTRYAREGHQSMTNTQPIRVETEHYEAVVSSDSKLAGWGEINTWFNYNPRENQTGAEVFGRVFLEELERTNGNVKEAGDRFFYRMDGKGTYSILMLLKEKGSEKVKLFAIRDPYAGQPFHMTQRDETFFLGSGTYAMENDGMGLSSIRELPNASITEISEDGINTEEYEGYKKEIMPCVFEPVYFGCPYDRVLRKLGKKYYELFDKYYKQLQLNPEFKNMKN